MTASTVSVPQTEIARTDIGPLAVKMYKVWDSCGGGFNVAVWDGANSLAHVHTAYTVTAQRVYDRLVRQYNSAYTQATEDTLMRYDKPQRRDDTHWQDDECECYELPDGRQHVCAACRRRQRDEDLADYFN